MSRWGRWTSSLVMICLVGACGEGTETTDRSEAATAQAKAELQMDLEGMEPRVATRLRQTRREALADLSSAEAWGAFGRVAHVHELWQPALAAYRRAERLDPENVRWPYFRGDVLSVLGDDPEAVVAAFERALGLRPEYAPAHLRLGNALLAAGRSGEAQAEFERALALAPDLQPAQVALAQRFLAEGDAERAAGLLEAVLVEAPRHGQALAALGQAYMRLGRRDEALQVAERARSAAAFNLYSDPLMSEVVAEGLSSVLIWDRAKAFLDNGNNEQAVLGLTQVVEQQPENVEALQQLAIAYGNLGRLDGARAHLERLVRLQPESIEPRVQLGTVLIDLGQPAAAIPHLSTASELSSDDPDAPWLLARARVLSGDVSGGLAAFESARAEGRSIPLWARNDWGSALAQAGHAADALAQFRAVLVEDPANAQALFYAGLLLEGQGQLVAASEHYCRSMRAEANPGAAARLEALSIRCP